MAGTATARALSEAGQQALVRVVVRGMVRGAVTPDLQEVVDAELAMVKGPLVMATPAGTAAVGERLAMAADSPERAAVYAVFERFLPVNHALRELCTAWQLRPDGTPNDHGDPTYDASVRDQLDDIDQRIGRLLKKLTAPAPGLAAYREELDTALAAFDGGDPSMFTSPLKPSYHTVWMWLHQELLLMLGISRAEDERLERELVAASAG